MRLDFGTRLVRDAGLARPVLAVTLRDSGWDFRLGYEVSTQLGFKMSAYGMAWESSPLRPASYGSRRGRRFGGDATWLPDEAATAGMQGH